MPTSASYAALQTSLRASWPQFTLRSVGDVERTFVVLHSLTLELPSHLFPVFPAYEERFLCLVLSLLRAPPCQRARRRRLGRLDRDRGHARAGPHSL